MLSEPIAIALQVEVSDHQWRDVVGVLKLQGSRLDGQYLRDMAGQMRIGDLLDRAVRVAA